MSLNRLLSISVGVFVVAFAAAYAPHAVHAQPAVFRSPQFVATAVRFKALHETHYNWMGSDEVLAVFSDFGPTHNDLLTSIYGDVDAGESRDFRPADRCIAPQPRCDRGVSDLHFKISMWENDDTGFAHGQLTGEHSRLENGAYWGDDLIGKAEVTIPRAELLATLPTVGASIEKTIRPVGGSGSYEFTYRITRLPNSIRIPPIGPPVAIAPISLEAVGTTSGPGRVTLTWSGATTTTVDIYRNGTTLLTTANDGSHVDSVSAGTYLYRVCNVGSMTFCSADVNVVVG
jgi:hypothetical protein